MKSLAELAALREQALSQIHMRNDDQEGVRIVVGMATCGIAAGARPVMSAFVEEVNKRKLENVAVVQTGCIGLCRLEPIVEVYLPGQKKVTYGKVTPEQVAKIVSDHVVNGKVVKEFTIGEIDK